MHRPHTTGESSPGPGAPGALPSSAMWQMPHRSSSVVHVHEATPCQFLMLILKPPSVLPAVKPSPLGPAPSSEPTSTSIGQGAADVAVELEQEQR